MLQHHDTNDQCNGGTHCLLQSPIWHSTPHVDSMMPVGIFIFIFIFYLEVPNFSHLKYSIIPMLLLILKRK